MSGSEYPEKVVSWVERGRGWGEEKSEGETHH